MTSYGMTSYDMLIDGNRVAGRDGASFTAHNPATGEAWATLPAASPDDVAEAVAAARRALSTGEWRMLSGQRRAALLFRLADLLEEHAEAIGRLETLDNGKLLRETTAQCGFAARLYRFYAGVTDKIMGEVIPLENGEILDFTLREPAGVCGLLIPWNSPMQILANKLAPALAAGNTVVVKPSEHASVSILAFCELVEQAGFPPGVVNVVTGTGGSVGAQLVEHDDVDLVSLTGGIETGRAVVRSAGTRIARLVLELGGKSPHIIFDDADLENAIEHTIGGIFAAAGQTCVAGSRLLVQDAIYDEFVERLVERTRKIRVGDPFDPASDMGPLANAPQLDRVMSFVETAVGEGARLACGGRRLTNGSADGLYFEPTIFVDGTNDMAIAREEVFGPVLTTIRFGDEDEAVAIANDSDFGLAAGLQTRSLARGLRMAKRLVAGTVWINTYRTVEPAAPFGGVGKSGFGRERGLLGLQEYTRVKNVMIDFGGTG